MKKGIKALLCTVAVGALAVFGAGCSLTETLKQLTCKHDYGATATEVTKNATCTDEGAELWTCTLCGKEKTETIAKTEHAFDEGIVTKAATCTATGEILYTCMTCETEKTELIEKTEHTRVDVEAKAPTCTEDGYTEYAYCADCNIFLSPKTVLNATGHTPTRVNGYAATCTEKGLTNGEVCATCETVLTAQTEIAAKGHNIVTVKGYAATCTGTGLTDGQACSTCGTVYVEQTEIAALGHSDTDEDYACDICEYVNLTVATNPMDFGTYRVYRTETKQTFDLVLLQWWYEEYSEYQQFYATAYIPALGETASSIYLSGVDQNIVEVCVHDKYVDFIFKDGTGTYTYNDKERELSPSDNPNWSMLVDEVTVYKVLALNE